MQRVLKTICWNHFPPQDRLLSPSDERRCTRVREQVSSYACCSRFPRFFRQGEGHGKMAPTWLKRPTGLTLLESIPAVKQKARENKGRRILPQHPSPEKGQNGAQSHHPRPKTHDPGVTPPPKKQGILWAWGFSSRKNHKMPGAHKIGAAISGPRITGRKITDVRLFLIIGKSAFESASF